MRHGARIAAARPTENVKPMPLMSTRTGMSPCATSQPPQAYSASSEAWMAPLRRLRGGWAHSL
jgi:hypothetical protein